jgi:hypothetical protein
MKRIALEEHYTTAALADSFRSLAIGFDKETVARLAVPRARETNDFWRRRSAGIPIATARVRAPAASGSQGSRR